MCIFVFGLNYYMRINPVIRVFLHVFKIMCGLDKYSK